MEDYYALLGVTPGASDGEIRAAFRQLAKRLHPDVSRLPSAAERFRRIVVAYETLSDPLRRAAYDASYRPTTSPGPAGAYGPSGEYLAPDAPLEREAARGRAKSAPVQRPARGGRTAAPAGRKAAQPRGPVTPVAPIGSVGAVSSGERTQRAAEAARTGAVRMRCVECGAVVAGESDRCAACLRKYGTFQEHLARAVTRARRA